LFDALALARGDGRHARLLKSLARVELLTLDDWGLAALTHDQARDLLEIVDDWHNRGSTIVTSPLPVDPCHEAIANPTVADAILDRLVPSTMSQAKTVRESVSDWRGPDSVTGYRGVLIVFPRPANGLIRRQERALLSDLDRVGIVRGRADVCRPVRHRADRLRPRRHGAQRARALHHSVENGLSRRKPAASSQHIIVPQVRFWQSHYLIRLRYRYATMMMSPIATLASMSREFLTSFL
jgi:IstB-like ATP binding protein